DAVLPGDDVPAWVASVLRALTPEPQPVGVVVTGPPEEISGWAQVQRSRARRSGGRELLRSLLSDPVELRAPAGDTSVAALLGRAAGRPVVGVAVAADVGGRPTPAGYRLAARAYRLAGRLGLPVLSLVDTPGADPGAEAEAAGVAPAMGEALDALLTCPTPTLALVHGEGGSGGALAAAAADVVVLTPDAYFAAIGPEGAAAALRRPAEECADLMGVTPRHLLALGAADALVPQPSDVVPHLVALLDQPDDARTARRRARWSAPLPGVARS
ncbi:MAG: carboxyl transferase domain-containing protein, partial [Actinomycetes bacterium]